MIKLTMRTCNKINTLLIYQIVTTIHKLQCLNNKGQVTEPTRSSCEALMH